MIFDIPLDLFGQQNNMYQSFVTLLGTVLLVAVMSCPAWSQPQPPAAAPTSTPKSTAVIAESDFDLVTQCAEIRDSLLMSTEWGIRLADFYYRFSPYALAATTHCANEGNSQVPWLVNVGIRCLAFTLRHPMIIWIYLVFLLFPVLAAFERIALRRMAPRGRERAIVIGWGALCIASGVLILFLKSGITGKDKGGTDRASLPEKLSTADPLSPAVVRSYAKARRLTVEDLAACLRHPSADVRYEAAYIAAKSPCSSYETELIGALKDSDLRVRRWAATALATLRSQAAFDELIELLKDPHAMVRYKAALALGKIRDRRAEGVLKERLADVNEYLCVRIFAFQALNRILREPQQN